MDYSIHKITSAKIKPLKPKHVQRVVGGSWSKDIPVSDIFRLLHPALKDNHWAAVFKSLIVVHILLRDGDVDRVSGFLASNLSLLDVSMFHDRTNTGIGIAQSKNIETYANYLTNKVKCYKKLKDDYVKSKDVLIARYRSLPIADGLIGEIEGLQGLVEDLLKCSFYLEEMDNVVTLQAYKLLVADMMSLFHLLNEGVIRLLGSYFEMEHSDAKRSLVIYKKFALQTKETVKFFDVARRLTHLLNLSIPEFKHAPLSLAGALEDYLNDPDFENQRQTYLQKRGKSSSPATVNAELAGSSTAPVVASGKSTTAPKNNLLIDFFGDDQQETSSTISSPAYSNQSLSSPTFNATQVQAPMQSMYDPFSAGAAQQRQIQMNLQATDQMIRNANYGFPQSGGAMYGNQQPQQAPPFQANFATNFNSNPPPPIAAAHAGALNPFQMNQPAQNMQTGGFSAFQSHVGSAPSAALPHSSVNTSFTSQSGMPPSSVNASFASFQGGYNNVGASSSNNPFAGNAIQGNPNAKIDPFAQFQTIPSNTMAIAARPMSAIVASTNNSMISQGGFAPFSGATSSPYANPQLTGGSMNNSVAAQGGLSSATGRSATTTTSSGQASQPQPSLPHYATYSSTSVATNSSSNNPTATGSSPYGIAGTQGFTAPRNPFAPQPAEYSNTGLSANFHAGFGQTQPLQQLGAPFNPGFTHPAGMPQSNVIAAPSNPFAQSAPNQQQQQQQQKFF